MNANTVFDISIVIVTFDNQTLIENCLHSLSEALSTFKAQLVIIDNHSQDHTVRMVDQVLSGPLTFQDTRFIANEQNTGFTRGVNQGLEYCTGDNILILNPDLFVRPDTFSVLFSLLKDSKHGVVAPQFRYPDGRIQASCRRFPRKRDVWYELTGLARLFAGNAHFNRWKMPDFDHNSNRDVEQPQGAFLLSPRSILQEVGMLDERFPMFFSDVDWCKRVVDAGHAIRFCSDVFVYHLKGASISKKRERMIVSSHRSFVDYFAKYDKSIADRLSTRILHLFLLMALVPRILLLRLTR